MLPGLIRDRRHFYDFQDFSLQSRTLRQPRAYEARIKEIAEVIHHRKRMLDAIGRDPVSDCDDFNLPSEEEARPWVCRIAMPASPFPIGGA